MTAAERVYIAVSGGKPDRVPVVPKITVHCATRLTGRPLREAIESPAAAVDIVLESARAAQADGIRLFPSPPRRTVERDGRLYETAPDGAVIGEIDALGGLATHVSDPAWIALEDPRRMAYIQYYTAVEPLVRSVADAARIAVPTRAIFEQLGWGRLQRDAIARAHPGMALIGDCNTATLSFAIYFRRYDNALLDLVENPPLVHALMEKGAQFAIERGKFHLDCGLRVLRLNDSAGNISVISPRHWREFVFPHLLTVCAELHRYHPEARIYCHICGNVLPILDDLVRAGLDCIGPLDPLGGVTCREARNRVGRRAALMGGVNAVDFARGTPEEIAGQARRCIADAGSEGGYVLGSGCMLPPDSRLENLLALAGAAREHGAYQ